MPHVRRQLGYHRYYPIIAVMYTEVNPEVLESLRSKGFKSVRLILLADGNKTQAFVEVVPGMEEGFSADLIQLNSAEILDYFDGPSAMARYLIDRKYI